MQKIIILDFTNGKVIVRTVPLELKGVEGDLVLEHFCDDLEISASNCQYMIVPNDKDEDWLDMQ